MHSILGYPESISANHYCRLCEMHKNEAAKALSEIPRLLGTPESYRIATAKLPCTLTASLGIKELCVWNRVEHFDVTRNICADVMHDGPEGVCKYVVSEMLHLFVYTYKIITIETLNDRLEAFTFGVNEKKNNSPEITPDNLKAFNPRMSA